VTSTSDPEQLRVLAVTNIWPVGDSYRGIFVKEQVEALRQMGVEVDVEVVAQDRGKADYLLAAARVRRRAREGNYDLVHVHYGMAAWSARFVRQLPRVLSVYGSDVNVPWQRAVTRMGWGGTAARIYVSPNLAANSGDPEGYVIADGVDFSLFSPGDRDEARASFGVAPGELVVLFGGHPDNQVKGYDVFTDVLTELRARGLPIREIVLVGTGQSRSAVPVKFAAADVMLFTSRKGSEGSPSVIKEASVMGLPVVSVNVGDAAEVLDGVTPSAVVDFPEPWGTDAARAALITTLADQTAHILAQGTRSNGRERNARLDSRRVAEQVMKIYRQILRTSSIPRSVPDGGEQ
jgi:teichuronic acid biosynthesis glycosyltransferase TuaC